MKIGYQGAYHEDNRAPESGNDKLTYRFNNGVPNQLTQRLEPYRTYSRVRYNALYLQDQWTHGRLTLSGALRYDHSWSYYPEQQIGPTRFLPTAIVFPETQGRHRLQRHHATGRRRVRLVRERQNRAQGERRQVPRSRRQRQRQLLCAAADVAHGHDADAQLDRLEQQSHPRLRSVERRRAEPECRRR